MKLTVQSRSNKVDIFGTIRHQPEKRGVSMPDGSPVKLRAKPIEFVIGDRSTSPEHALMTLSVEKARELANSILRVTGREGD